MSHSKQWRQPEPAQLQCEQNLAHHLSILVLSGDIRDHVLSFQQVYRDDAAAAIAPYLEQAQALGHGYAQKQLARLERGLGNAIKGGMQWAIDQARILVDRALSWAQELFASKIEELGDDATDEDIEEALEEVAETVADTLALTDIQSVIEQAVMSDLEDAGIAMIEAVNEPDACELCMQNAEAGPIPIGTPFPSGETSAPFHHRCRCHVEAVQWIRRIS